MHEVAGVPVARFATVESSAFRMQLLLDLKEPAYVLQGVDQVCGCLI